MQLLPKARADIRAIAAYIAEDSPRAARRVRRDIQQRVDMLAEWPEHGRSGTVQVLRVIDGRRDLGTVFFSPLLAMQTA